MIVFGIYLLGVAAVFIRIYYHQAVLRRYKMDWEMLVSIFLVSLLSWPFYIIEAIDWLIRKLKTK
jgi:hypothetical protein